MQQAGQVRSCWKCFVSCRKETCLRLKLGEFLPHPRCGQGEACSLNLGLNALWRLVGTRLETATGEPLSLRVPCLSAFPTVVCDLSKEK